MKKILILFLLICVKSWSQKILQLTETDQNNNTHQVQKVVDINSDIHFDINMDQLNTKVSEMFPTQSNESVDSLLSEVKLLHQILLKRAEKLDALQNGLTAFASQPEGRRNIDSLRTTLRPVARDALRVTSTARSIPELEKRLNNVLENMRGASIYKRYDALFNEAFKYTEELIAKLNNELNESNVNIKLGAWLRSRRGDLTPIHLEGFDTLSLGQFVEVPRFAVSLTEEQKKELQNIGNVAESLNTQGVGKTLENLTETMIPSIKTIIGIAENCVDTLKQDFSNLQTQAGVARTRLDTLLQEGKSDLANFVSFLTTLKTKYTSANSFQSGSNLLSSINSDLANLEQETDQTLKNILGLKPKLEGEIDSLAGNVKNIGLTVIGQVENCSGDLGRTFKSTIQSLFMTLSSVLNIHKSNNSILEFSSAVLSHNVNNIPKETQFSLLNTGSRKEGDAIVIRMAASLGSNKNDRTLESRTISVYQVLMHLKTVVSLAFVDTDDKPGQDRKRFQAAPSYSVLFKWGKRSKVTYNRFWRPGIGLNIAAPDVDQDDVPDIAISAVISVVNDWLHFGYGYNLTVEEPYWSFGLRLPLLSVVPFDFNQSVD